MQLYYLQDIYVLPVKISANYFRFGLMLASPAGIGNNHLD